MKGRLTIFFSLILLHGFPQGNWTQKANVGGPARLGAVGFSIGNNAFIGTGSPLTNSGPFYKDFWEYNYSGNSWTQKADFPGGPRVFATGFSIGIKGYVGTGCSVFTQSGYQKEQDFWEYDALNNTWVQKANFPGTPRDRAIGFSIGDKGYIGTGEDTYFTKDFWEWDQSTDTWTQKTSFPTTRENAVGFSIGDKGYICTGYNYPCHNDLWEWDPSLNSWSQKANFPGTPRQCATCFVIGKLAYIGSGTDFTGNSGGPQQDFYAWDVTSNTWMSIPDLTGPARECAVGFSINGKGFVGTGFGISTPMYNDFWEFNPSPTSVNEINNSSELSIFPNPTNDVVNINFSSTIPNTSLSLLVTNSAGQYIYQKEIKEACYPYCMQINVATFPKGIYFVEVLCGNERAVKKLVLQ